MRVVIRSDVLEGILDAAKRHYPREFFCLLGGHWDGDSAFVDEIVYIPFKNGERSVVFNPYTIPIDGRIIGSAHSHPRASPPSRADRKTFPQTGWVHIIVYPPFDQLSVSAYDAAGRKIPLEVV
ncbi:MAG: hypothetical protein PWP76_277 [Candidatus Diapherotrites archaeon]|nr:hypothetical protein [Candidatus Diapherotrites archaeon]MDN5366746.1 hypothetical protein [Candidatus Diapherotrites archaeon]